MRIVPIGAIANVEILWPDTTDDSHWADLHAISLGRNQGIRIRYRDGDLAKHRC